MRKFALTLVLLEIGLCRPVLAQNLPAAEVFGGYSYLNVDTNGLSSRQSANGWEASVAGSVNRWFAVESDFAGYYKNILGVSVRDYSYTAGPRFNYRDMRSATIFAHALVGGDHLSGSYSGLSGSQDGFAAAFGGGVEWKVAARWAVRGSSDYVLTRHNIFGGSAFTQNNYRASVGVVYMFGGLRERTPRPTKDQPASKQCIGSAESALLGLTGCSNSDGFLVSSVREGSPGAVAAIRAGDVVTEIGGRPVHSAQDIDAAIGSSSTVKISYMVKGSWLAVREVKLP
jgi:hypothetical protein